MTLYFFDMRDGADLFPDEEGLELPNLKAVQIEAARALGSMTKQTLWTKAKSQLGHQMAVEVRDAVGPVLQASFTFEIERHKQ
ncbi:hypothetical protein JQ596_16995 [Bradyrhizobium manausense]|uniref:DUF6894 family protein n=1 Tax=Bradyrhizobium TaxID=374 RepID=UPI001BA46FCA|nr:MULTISPECIES: hypothetical protein [Bradyrhizobium]MBR0827228.1 hypothetical protein [Bradyrhizobium manausense]UVO27125.1 hypothetical protein KUF59_32080 [Bradyrhizobium arachidis]